MTSKINESERNDSFLRSLVAEVIETPDEDVLAGTDRDELIAFGAGILERATAEAGRRRLAVAKSRMAAVPSVSALPSDMPPVAEVRVRLAALSASGQLTLAAREMDAMPDEEILRLYAQALQLQQEADDET
jgi:hypothetical protein